MPRRLLHEIAQLALYRVQLLAARERQAFLQALKEGLDLLIGRLLDEIELDLVIVQRVSILVGKVVIVSAAEFLRARLGQLQIVAEELEYRHEALLAVHNLETHGIIGCLEEIELRKLPATEQSINEVLLFRETPDLLALPLRYLITVAALVDLVQGPLLRSHLHGNVTRSR